MKVKRKTKCKCGEYLMKGDNYCHICQRLYKPKNTVEIIVRGGIAEAETFPKNIVVRIIDFDTDNGQPEVSAYSYKRKK